MESREAGAEAFGVSAVFDESEFFVEGYSPQVFRHYSQLKLDIPRSLRALDARLRERAANPKPPVIPRDADAELRTVAHFVLSACGFYSRSSDDYAAD